MYVTEVGFHIKFVLPARVSQSISLEKLPGHIWEENIDTADWAVKPGEEGVVGEGTSP